MNKKIVNLGLAILASCFSTGCINLQHGEIISLRKVDKGPMGVSERAEQMNGIAGFVTFTLFAIPIAPVMIAGEEDKELMSQIKAAVETAGYQVKTVDNASLAVGVPVLSCKVERFKFWDYSYLFPYVFNWGTIRLDVTITAPDGKVLWNKVYTGKGHGYYSYARPVKEALTSILNDLANDLVNADFNNKSNDSAHPSETKQ